MNKNNTINKKIIWNILVFSLAFALGCKSPVVEVRHQTVDKFVDIKVSTTISEGYVVGDCLFYDKSTGEYFLESKEYFIKHVSTKDFDKTPIIGVLSYEINGMPYFIGLRRAPAGTCWAVEEAIGFGALPELSGTLGSGALWGISSGAVLKKLEDYDSTANANYPAMYWVQNYESYEGAGEKGDWFLPSAFEALQIFNASQAHDEVLATLQSKDSTYELFWDAKKCNYWTSTTNECEKLVDAETGETQVESTVWVYRNELSAIRDEKKSDTKMENGNLGTMSALAVKTFSYKNIKERFSE